MDINLVRYSANYNTTAECRINNFIIDKAVLDGGSQCTLMNKKLSPQIGLKIDTRNPPPLKGVSIKSKSIGWSYNIPITFTNKTLPRDTDFILPIDIIIIDDDEYDLVIETDWLDLARAKPDYNKWEFHVGNTFVPISVHKSTKKK